MFSSIEIVYCSSYPYCTLIETQSYSNKQLIVTKLIIPIEKDAKTGIIITNS